MARTSNKADMILDYVNHFNQENGYAPSVREIGAAVGLRSTASVSYHLQQLQQKGLLLLRRVLVIQIAGNPDGSRTQDQGYVVALTAHKFLEFFHGCFAPP
jgi:SOS-response transcriptional repressor LexA